MRDFLIFLSWIMIICGFFVFIALRSGINAGYGRYTNTAYGINPKLAWFIQESPSLFIPLYFCLVGTSNSGRNVLRLICCHYLNRAIIYPFEMRSGALSPYWIVFSATFFCTYNGFLQGAWNAYYQPEDESFTWHHGVGILLFFSGMGINHVADRILHNLRAPGETGYRIPTGWLYEYISCPNYFGEIIEWIGLAIFAWNLPATAFAIFTFSNIGPRAVSHHRWYKEKFPGYPKNRKALIPYLY